MATLHTWSRTLIEHAHIHCLVTEGGLSKDSHWKKRNNGYLLPVRAVMPVFRGKMLAYVHRAIEKGELTIPETMSFQKWKNLRNKLGRKKWNVHIRERYEYGKGVLSYLSRYIRGGAISNRRIVSYKNGEVTFRCRTGRRSKDTMSIPVERFMKRYFNHVPEPYTKIVRYYGLYAPTANEDLEECRRQLCQQPIQVIEEIDWQSYCGKRGNKHPEQCPVCGRKLLRLSDIPRPYYSEPPARNRLRTVA
ncbi:MAG: transposase [Flavobacteriales bacterium]